MHSLNTTCETVGVLDGFRETVVRHEETHQSSGNKCIRIMNRRWMGHVEEAVSGDRDHVEDVLDRTWGGVVDDLLDAKETAQGSISADIWEHRKLGRWTDGVRTAGHSGTNGC